MENAWMVDCGKRVKERLPDALHKIVMTYAANRLPLLFMWPLSEILMYDEANRRWLHLHIGPARLLKILHDNEVNKTQSLEVLNFAASASQSDGVVFSNGYVYLSKDDDFKNNTFGFLSQERIRQLLHGQESHTIALPHDFAWSSDFGWSDPHKFLYNGKIEKRFSLFFQDSVCYISDSDPLPNSQRQIPAPPCVLTEKLNISVSHPRKTILHFNRLYVICKGKRENDENIDQLCFIEVSKLSTLDEKWNIEKIEMAYSCSLQMCVCDEYLVLLARGPPLPMATCGPEMVCLRTNNPDHVWEQLPKITVRLPTHFYIIDTT
jgi:hypothetical protein